MVFELQRQPFRSLYLAFQAVKTYIIRLPAWYLLFIPRFLRPRPSWSLQKCIAVPQGRLYSMFGPITQRVGFFRSWPTYRAIPDDPKLKSVWIDPVPDLILGDVQEWAGIAGVQPIRVPGYWLDKKGLDTQINEKPAPEEKVILYLHGGGFISESAHPSNPMSVIPSTLMTRCASSKRAFAVEYRLCDLVREPRNPFPAALIDALAGYRYLVDVVGFAPGDIIVLGDSAGGNLVLALARYLVENIDELSTRMEGLKALPVAHALVLLSPWSDLGVSHFTPGSAALTFTYDFLTDLRPGHMLGEACKAYAGPLGLAATNANRYLSPASVHPDMGQTSFRGFPRSFIVVGDAERLLDMCRTLKEKMVKDMGAEQVGYFEAKDAIHDHLFFPFEEHQNRETLNAIEKWLAQAT
ncbi:hypothetical protein AcW1_003725 [Taiwanofungus camphoratus]|nr:hypothetical protein AcW1_003725 [Antrodia cinnamomea]